MNIRLGIIGGGQLGLYLCEAAQKLGSEVSIIAEPGSPALPLADKPFSADLDCTASLERFLVSCDVVTFDKEAIPDTSLSLLNKYEQNGRISVRPRADALGMLKDKALQKAWLIENGLPTLPFWVMSENPEPLDFLTEKFGSDLVQKARSGGYDGRGVQIISAPYSQQSLWPVPSIIEPYLPECREISVVLARARSGEIQTYPVVEMVFDPELNSVKTVAMPAAITSEQYAAAVALACEAVNALAGVGVFAIEMFITPEGEILINEISPRVHNSGHVTMDACNVSQFEQHVRAVLGLPLIPVSAISPAAVMLNILYSGEMLASCPDKLIAEEIPELESTVYWYGKTPGRIGRKMGHINSVGMDAGEALERAHRILREYTGSGGEQAA